MMRKKLGVFFLTGLMTFLWGCQANVSALKQTEPPVEELKMVVTDESIAELGNYPDLKHLDLTGSTCYEAIRQYEKTHPDVEVEYRISVGEMWVDPEAETLTLNNGEYDFRILEENLTYLDKLKDLNLPLTDLAPEQLGILRKYVNVHYSVEILGNVYDSDMTELDLSELAPEDVETAAQGFAMLPGIQDVEMRNEAGESKLSLGEVHTLQQAMPDAFFHYTFTLFGKQVSTEDETVEIVNKRIGDKGEEEARQALDLLKKCKYFALDNCQFSNEVMAKMREDYRDRTKVVWRIFFANQGSCRTDRQVIRYVYNLYDYNCSQLQYCEDAEYIDFGHNETLSDCSWVANMKNLKAIILSGSLIDDLSAFANCESLEFLEIAYCSRIRDLSPLANCKNLVMVNTSFTGVEDLSPLDGLNLERLCSVSSKVPEEEQERFRQTHPECLTLFEGTQPYGYCWRYLEDGRTPTEYYAKLKEVFHYPNATDTIW